MVVARARDRATTITLNDLWFDGGRARARDRATTITLKDLWFDGGRVRFTKISDFYGRAGQAQEHTGLREQPPRDPVGLRPGQRAGDHGSDVPGDGCAGRGHTRRVFSFCFVPPPRGQHFFLLFCSTPSGQQTKRRNGPR